MPFLKMELNLEIQEDGRRGLLTDASRIVSATLNKPEEDMLVSVRSNAELILACSTAPAAFLELRVGELPSARRAELSRQLSEAIRSRTGISDQRVYISFAP